MAPVKIVYRWVVLALCVAVMTTSFTVRFAWSTAAAKVSDEIGFDATTLGSFVTAFFVGYVITNVISGYLSDRYGPRLVICVSLLPLAAFVASFGSMSSVPVGLVLQVGMGLTAGVNYSGCVKLVASWFDSSERGLALGFLSAASSISLITSNSLFPTFIEDTSWRALYYCLGAEVVLMMLLCSIGLRDGPASGTARPQPLQASFRQTIKSFVADRDYRILAVVEFFGLWAVWGVAFWTNALMVKGHGLSNISAGRVMAVVGIGGLIAKPLYGWLSDALPIRRKYMLAPALVGLVVTLMIFGQMNTERQFLLFAPVLGAFTFGFTPLMAAILTEIVDGDKIGAAAGLMNSLVQCSAVLSPLAVGVVFDYTGSFVAVFSCLAAGPFIAAIAALMIREPKKRLR